MSPIEATPASYKPGVSLARGSFASEPVIPGGRGGAGSGAKGLLSSSSSFSLSASFALSASLALSLSAVCCDGDVAGVCVCGCACARRLVTPKHKNSAATMLRRARSEIRFIACPFLEMRFYWKCFLSSISCMILISARCPVSTSVAKLNSSASCPAPAVSNKTLTMVSAPLWC